MKLKKRTKAAISLFILSLILYGVAWCQTARCDHQAADFWATLRALPVTITSIEKETVYWKYEDRRSVALGSFVLSSETKGDPKPGKSYLAFYCDTHKTAYLFEAWTKPP